MPELPEVEVIRQRLSETVIDRTIASVRVSENNYAFLTPPGQLRRQLLGHRFTHIRRSGKYLLFGLENSSCFVIHLGMTGQLFSSRALSPRLHNQVGRTKKRRSLSFEFEPDQHTHLSLSFGDNGDQLHFRDCRKFGKLLWIAANHSDPRLDRLGPDALSITVDQFARGVKGRNVPIKSLLLDQSLLAGVGNIYADESLHAARIDPTRPANSLSIEEDGVLVRAIRRKLRQAIALGGSSIDDYIHPDGSDGEFQKRFAVYGRQGKPCRRCGKQIQRIVIGQRGTHYCAGCQQ